jgi:hypothetical protein
MSLDRCACKRGFFTLRDCANQASTSCMRCTRRICSQHITPSGICAECAARAQEDTDLGPDPDPLFGALFARDRWYSSSSYEPMWWATPDPFWSGTDYRWHDSGNYDDDDGGGFGDS